MPEVKEMEFNVEADAGVFLAHLTLHQRQRFDALDTAYIDLLSQAVPDRADIEALAEGVVAFYDALAESHIGRDNGA